MTEFFDRVPMPLDRPRNGSFSVALRVPNGQRSTYRFLLDGDRFINDCDADDYVVEADDTCVSLLHT